MHIVFTGIGIISSLGIGREAFWENCKKAKTGIKKITSFDTGPFKSNIGGVVEGFDPGRFMPSMSYRRMSRISRMSVAASVEALKDSGLILDTMDKERIAVIMGTAYGSSSHVEEFYAGLLRDGPRGAQPFLFPDIVPNAAASHIAIFHGITGPNNTFCQNEISAENAILYARDLLCRDLVDVVLVGGADELSAALYACYDAVGGLNRIKVNNDQPVKPAPGGGLVLGEGAGVLVMETYDHALKRNAKIYGTLAAGVIRGGITSNGHYETAGTEMGRAMSMAIEEAGLDPDEIDHFDVSANFSGELDRMEYDQLKRLFKDRMDYSGVTPLKYLMGDFGGAGAVRAAAILLSLHHQSPLPTVSIETLKGAPQNYPVWDKSPSDKILTVLMTTSTFGGGSASLIFTKPRRNSG